MKGTCGEMAISQDFWMKAVDERCRGDWTASRAEGQRRDILRKEHVHCKQRPRAIDTTVNRWPSVGYVLFFSTLRKAPLDVVEWVLLSLNKKCAARSGVTAQMELTKPITIRYHLS